MADAQIQQTAELQPQSPMEFGNALRALRYTALGFQKFGQYLHASARCEDFAAWHPQECLKRQDVGTQDQRCFSGWVQVAPSSKLLKKCSSCVQRKICQIAQVKLRWDTSAPSSRKHVLFLTSRVVLSDWRCKCTLQSWMPSPCSRCNMWTINSADALESFAWKKSETAKRRMYPCSRQPVTWSFGLWKLHRSLAWSTELLG